MNKIRFIFVALVWFIAANLMAAEIPFIINYQGNVVDATGSPLNGSGYFKFAIVDQAGTSAYWVNDNSVTNGTQPTTSITVPVTNGVFSIKLGDTNLASMAALSASIFNNTNIFLRVWFSFDGLNFEQFSPDTQIVSTGFAFRAQEANAVVESAVTSLSIEDNTISNADISDTAAISASKINSLGLDSDTLDGLDAADFAVSTHTHTNIDADTVDGFHADTFAARIHGHTHAEMLGIGSSDHHVKTTLFADLVDGISVAQIPDSITRNADLATSYLAKSGDVMTGPLTVNANVSVRSLSFQNPKTQFLMLAGGQCAGTTGVRRAFSCEIRDKTSPVYWSVNVPNGATLLGMRVNLATAGGVTTCRLESGVLNPRVVVTTIIDSGPLNGHWTTETSFSQLVDTSAKAYAVSCSKSTPGTSSNIGAIRIRYSVLRP